MADKKTRWYIWALGGKPEMNYAETAEEALQDYLRNWPSVKYGTGLYVVNADQVQRFELKVGLAG